MPRDGRKVPEGRAGPGQAGVRRAERGVRGMGSGTYRAGAPAPAAAAARGRGAGWRFRWRWGGEVGEKRGGALRRGVWGSLSSGRWRGKREEFSGQLGVPVPHCEREREGLTAAWMDGRGAAAWVSRAPGPREHAVPCPTGQQQQRRGTATVPCHDAWNHRFRQL